jgi:UDP-N-acetyl-D-glucosamine dehydrogenase
MVKAAPKERLSYCVSPGPHGRDRPRSLAPEVIARYDAVLIATDHDDVDYKSIAQNGKLVIDTRNACERAGARGPHIVKA